MVFADLILLKTTLSYLGHAVCGAESLQWCIFLDIGGVRLFTTLQHLKQKIRFFYFSIYEFDYNENKVGKSIKKFNGNDDCYT